MAETIEQPYSDGFTEEQSELIASSRNDTNARLSDTMDKKTYALILLLLLQVAERIKEGKSPIPMGAYHLWAYQLKVGQITEGKQSARMGFDSAEKLISSIGQELPYTPNPYDTMYVVGVEEYFNKHTHIQSQTLINVVQKTVDTLEKGTGSKQEIADAFLSKMKVKMRVYSRLIAQTGVIWANNEGVMRGYSSKGVRRMMWYTVRDEKVCPFCGVLHGKIIYIGAGFVSAGERVQAEVDNISFSMQMPSWDITHPPLHNRCRCILLPVF